MHERTTHLYLITRWKENRPFGPAVDVAIAHKCLESTWKGVEIVWGNAGLGERPLDINNFKDMSWCKGFNALHWF